MTVGDVSLFALESFIAEAYTKKSFRALGYFNIHIGGMRYGKHTKDATLLACSYDEVTRRIQQRGSHISSLVDVQDAELLARAITADLYSNEGFDHTVLHLSEDKISEHLYAKHILWAPDGDAAFDDGGHVLQFDIASKVRLVGFVNSGNDNDLRVRDVYINADDFYTTLESWKDMFDTEWEEIDKLDI